jgi:hypothetical protein
MVPAVPVFVRRWEIESSGHPPTIGARVEWQLAFVAVGTSWLTDVASVAFDAELTPSDYAGTLVCSGALVAHWESQRLATRRVHLTGIFTAGHHHPVRETVPATLGRIGRMCIVTRTHTFTEKTPRWEASAGTVEVHPVETSPAHFRALPYEGDPRKQTVEEGLLVDFEVIG